MLKRLALGTAIAALMLTTAAAQTPTKRGEFAGRECVRRISSISQKPDQWLASNFKGTDVLGADDKKIGDVS